MVIPFLIHHYTGLYRPCGKLLNPPGPQEKILHRVTRGPPEHGLTPRWRFGKMSFLLQKLGDSQLPYKFSGLHWIWLGNKGQRNMPGHTTEPSLSKAISKKKQHESEWESKGTNPQCHVSSKKKKALLRDY